MRALYLIYQICIALPLFLLSTIITSLTVIIGSCFNAHIWGYYPPKLWGRFVCRILLLPLHIEGKEKLEKGRSYVFVPNHQSSMDIFLVYGYIGRNFKWMMKQGLRKVPFIGQACQSAGHIYIDHSSPHKMHASMVQAEAILRSGTSLVVFPEGSRTFTGHLSSFKRGAFQLADEFQLSVVPVTIDGAFEVLPRFGKTIHRHSMKLIIHDPIHPIGKGSENIHATMEKAYKVIHESLPEKYQ